MLPTPPPNGAWFILSNTRLTHEDRAQELVYCETREERASV